MYLMLTLLASLASLLFEPDPSEGEVGSSIRVAVILGVRTEPPILAPVIPTDWVRPCAIAAIAGT